MARCKLRTTVTPPELAARWGINADKVHKWIKSGELDAHNVATSGRSERPRYVISEEAIKDFTLRRKGNTASTPPAPRRRKTENVTEYV